MSRKQVVIDDAGTLRVWLLTEDQIRLLQKLDEMEVLCNAEISYSIKEDEDMEII